MNTKKLISLLMLVVMVSGCAANAVLNGASEQAGPAEKSINLFNKEPSDKDLFDEALSLLNNQENKPKYDEAKIRLENMILQYPKSKWAAGAQALILTLDRISELEAALNTEKTRVQNERGKLTREIDGLKGNLKKAEEYATETTRLQQENEQLKRDIEQLKNLEIRLEQREKMLR